MSRPPFLLSTADVAESTHRYPKSDEPMGPKRSVGSAASAVQPDLGSFRFKPHDWLSYTASLK